MGISNEQSLWLVAGALAGVVVTFGIAAELGATRPTSRDLAQE